MSHGWRVILGAGLAAAVLALSGCVSADDNPFEGASTPSRPTSSSTAQLPTQQDKDDLVAALNKNHAGRYTFAVVADLATDGKVAATGAVDPAAKLFGSTIKITETASPTAIERVVVNGQAYLRDAGDKSGKWMHLDVARLPQNSPFHLDLADPVGLAKFTASIANVSRGSTPGAYNGTFDALKAGELPVGAPVEHCFCMNLMPFRATVDAQGRIASLAMDLAQTGDRPTLTMTTTFSGFDAAVSLKPPAKANTFEAPDSTYK